ncbi:hypothetical protein C8D99_106116 [Aminivibrio pyruvatiphilus]|uniref:Uncharacterized protein n=1 Tax=Aminivibrio pyruvatiphilus TaxID=1005740 RepID=A0A4V3HGG8_9BACT|nr:hypothetical protein [Aminivibrio pyruvatiphilus]TDY61261.1 hypothetical protein C8D99_106116 [Aminivibrio pyruvatiphilus]
MGTEIKTWQIVEGRLSTLRTNLKTKEEQNPMIWNPGLPLIQILSAMTLLSSDAR